MDDPTPEERAKKVLESGSLSRDIYGDLDPQAVVEIEDQIRAAVQAETERCAMVAEVYIHSSTPELDKDRDDLDNIAAYSNSTCKIIAAAIRSPAPEPADD